MGFSNQPKNPDGTIKDPRTVDSGPITGSFGNAPQMEFDGNGNAIGNQFDQSQPGKGELVGSGVATALFNTPGAAEQSWSNTQAQWGQPTNIQGYWEGVAGKWNGGTPTVSNNAQSAYDAYMKNMPAISPEANMGSFYDNARTRQTQDMNTQLGARGAFNSSAALDKLAQGEATLNAQQAKDEAQYGIDRASTMGNLWKIGGGMASDADAQSLGAANFERSWVDTLGALASKADETKLSFLEGGAEAAEGADSARTDRLVAAATAALGSQGARDERIQGAFNNINKLGEQLAGVASDAYVRILGGDQALMDAALSGDVARVAEALNISNDQANRIMKDLSAVAEVGVALAGKGG